MAIAEIDRGFVIGAQRILASKLAMQATLPRSYIHDPAVAILLGLFIERADGTRSTLKTLCQIARYVPETNVNRWIKAIKNDGLLLISGSENEDYFVTLTDRGVDMVRSMILAVGKAQKTVHDDSEISPHLTQIFTSTASKRG